MYVYLPYYLYCSLYIQHIFSIFKIFHVPTYARDGARLVLVFMNQKLKRFGYSFLYKNVRHFSMEFLSQFRNASIAGHAIQPGIILQPMKHSPACCPNRPVPSQDISLVSYSCRLNYLLIPRARRPLRRRCKLPLPPLRRRCPPLPTPKPPPRLNDDSPEPLPAPLLSPQPLPSSPPPPPVPQLSGRRQHHRRRLGAGLVPPSPSSGHGPVHLPRRPRRRARSWRSRQGQGGRRGGER